MRVADDVSLIDADAVDEPELDVDVEWLFDAVTLCVSVADEDIDSLEVPDAVALCDGVSDGVTDDEDVMEADSDIETEPEEVGLSDEW